MKSRQLGFAGSLRSFGWAWSRESVNKEDASAKRTLVRNWESHNCLKMDEVFLENKCEAAAKQEILSAYEIYLISVG